MHSEDAEAVKRWKPANKHYTHIMSTAAAATLWTTVGLLRKCSEHLNKIHYSKVTIMRLIWVKLTEKDCNAYRNRLKKTET